MKENKYLLLIECEVRTVSYGPEFFPSYGPGRKKGWAGKRATAPQKRAMRGTPRRFLKENMVNVRRQCRLLQFGILCSLLVHG